MWLTASLIFLMLSFRLREGSTQIRHLSVKSSTSVHSPTPMVDSRPTASSVLMEQSSTRNTSSAIGGSMLTVLKQSHSTVSMMKSQLKMQEQVATRVQMVQDKMDQEVEPDLLREDMELLGEEEDKTEQIMNPLTVIVQEPVL